MMVEIAAASLESRRGRIFSSFETWPAWLFYTPIGLCWFYFAARYGGLTLPTIANTAPALSGFLGESKSEAFRLLGPRGREHLPPYAVAATADPAEESVARAADAMAEAALGFPVVGKPDIGQNGAGVKILRDASVLADWLASFRPGTKVILQKYLPEEGEAGVFFVRYPDEARGRVVSLTLKFLPRVIGDGLSTLRELILQDPRARHIASVYFARHGKGLDRVVPFGEEVRLVSVGNHCRGAIFKNGVAHITPQMESVFNTIAAEIPGFSFGRFDIKYRSLADFQRGENFTILEINGADAEMTHIWDAEETLAGAYATLYRQYRTVFEIGAQNRSRGAKPASPGAFLKAWIRNRARLKSYSREE